MKKMIEMENMVAEMLGAVTESVKNAEKAEKPATAGQLKYISDLANRKGIKVDSDKCKDFSSADAYIKELKEFTARKPVSDKQKERILNACKVLEMPEPNWEELDGSFGGSASMLIQKLDEMLKNKPRPASEKQVALIMKMQLCPDCPVISLDGLLIQAASEYISKYQNAYQVWIKSRLSVDQLNRIRQLHDMMEVPFDYAGIIQLDAATASKYITQLEVEFDRKDWLETSLEPTVNYESGEVDAREELRTLCIKLYASIGQELEEDWFETLKWESLKELVNFVKLFGVNVAGMIEDCKIFNANQKAMLINA